MKNITLNNGVEVPVLGFGTYQIPDVETEEAVYQAIKAGYRHIDTAQSYLNEAGVGRGVVKSGVPREELFITTKIWVENVSYEGVKASFRGSLDRLQMDYVDLLLLHQPFNDVYGAWRAMEELLKEGKVRAIGISNFAVDRAIDLKEFNEITPQVNQIEINPFQQQAQNIEVLLEEGIVPEAWAPFAEGKNDIFNNPILSTIGKKYGKTTAQVIVRWLVERGVIVLAKSVNPDRMAQNIDVFDFELSEEDHAAISELNVEDSQFFSHSDPQIIKWMASRRLGI